jgi:hypothetical protein
MARTIKTVQVPSFPNCKNRDLGKTFLITEWDALTADRWIQRVAYAVVNTGGTLPLDLKNAGWEGIAIMGINSLLRGNMDPNIMIPLAEELLNCVQIIPDPKFPEQSLRRADLDGDIEEIATRWWLRNEVVSVHTGFSPADALSALISSIMTPRTTD